MLRDWKFVIFKNWEEVLISLTFDEKIKIKLWYTYYYDFENDLFVTQVPEWVDFEEEKLKYLTSQENKIKKKYQDLIFEKYSLTDQLNLSNRATEILWQALFEKRDLSESETIELYESQNTKKWIDEQRKLCSEEIKNLYINT